jgi:hypothetical protein
MNESRQIVGHTEYCTRMADGQMSRQMVATILTLVHGGPGHHRDLVCFRH